eukprot:GHVT01020894.1.p1 GENE.GHVT01020894.1~~GHVT01020894.1.p1  ORF type:complete len:157 (-),score=4.23 GHVT01020894.1:18-488(-)
MALCGGLATLVPAKWLRSYILRFHMPIDDERERDSTQRRGSKGKWGRGSTEKRLPSPHVSTKTTAMGLHRALPPDRPLSDCRRCSALLVDPAQKEALQFITEQLRALEPVELISRLRYSLNMRTHEYPLLGQVYAPAVTMVHSSNAEIGSGAIIFV